MTEKEKQAKLQYLLNSLSMTKEQKDIVIDLVNSSGCGAPANDVVILELIAKGDNVFEANVLFNGVKEFTEIPEINFNYENTYVTSEVLYNYLLAAHNKNNIIQIKFITIDDIKEIEIVNNPVCTIFQTYDYISYYYPVQKQINELTILKYN